VCLIYVNGKEIWLPCRALIFSAKGVIFFKDKCGKLQQRQDEADLVNSSRRKTCEMKPLCTELEGRSNGDRHSKGDWIMRECSG
jgi:hypothetical protein